MELKIAHQIINAYGFDPQNITVQQIGSGHINRTYLLLTLTGEKYILQQVNSAVFKDPLAIANNTQLVSEYLKADNPDYLFPAPLRTEAGTLMYQHEEEYWRLMPYIDNAVALDTLENPKQAYEAAKQFGKLSRLLKDFNPTKLQFTIPGFHDLAMRYEQLLSALRNAGDQVKETAREEISTIIGYHFIVEFYHAFEGNIGFPDRVMHHDTKISNVLLEETGFTGICVIDLDTLMPGKFISDLGDMMRTYLCAFDENETDLTKITIRLPYFQAMINGYLSEMAEILTETEKEMILFSGKYIVYMQALRFLTDYISGSIYYPTTYPSQNLDRTKNQLKLLSELFQNEKILQDIIEECLS